MVQHARGEFGVAVWNKCQRDVSRQIVFEAVAAAPVRYQINSIDHLHEDLDLLTYVKMNPQSKTT